MRNHPDILGIRINYLDKTAVRDLGEYISGFFQEKTLIVCIGTDKCIGDCLGPLVGTFLTKNNFPYPVVGTLDFPAHAINLEKVIKNVKLKYPDYFTIAIDACLGYEDCIGDIQVKLGPVHPGKGVGKVLPQVGDISIVGVVDTIDNSDVFSIRNTRLSFIMAMAEVVSEALLYAAKKVST
ncbi:spore protease YyaC [Fonticella tunisiensis]|uniref:Putative sporulation protein YyaC n=1 Tax=Fonticella tunisiensis TaxID=1096341 RepID=A0A4R7KVJ4_9CLOT|nr:spore protease YyaC [Fonticella tunisiensis]TDT62403.1 putative sporulation protein YyaC [Fonticella tunisiensis]